MAVKLFDRISTLDGPDLRPFELSEPSIIVGNLDSLRAVLYPAVLGRLVIDLTEGMICVDQSRGRKRDLQDAVLGVHYSLIVFIIIKQRAIVSTRIGDILLKAIV